MKKLLLTLFLLVTSIVSMSAQSYISYVRAEHEDMISDLNGAGGVLVISKRADLVFTVDNASHPVVTPKGKREDGMYVYEIVVAKEDNPTPKIEVSKRGDVDRVSFAVTTRKDFFLAFWSMRWLSPSVSRITSRPTTLLPTTRWQPWRLRQPFPTLSWIVQRNWRPR